jgi:hypothetical protein
MEHFDNEKDYYLNEYKKTFKEWQETEIKCRKLRDKLFLIRDIDSPKKIPVFPDGFTELFKLSDEAEKKRQEFGKAERKWNAINQAS